MSYGEYAGVLSGSKGLKKTRMDASKEPLKALAKGAGETHGDGRES